MGAKKHKTPDHIGVSCSEETKDLFDTMAKAYGLKRSDFFHKVFDEWLNANGFTTLQKSKLD